MRLPPSMTPDLSFETAARSRGLAVIAGVDEAGRGPLAGPVVAAAVILDPDRLPEGLADSKSLSAKARDRTIEAILTSAQTGTGLATVEEIDRLNILRASHLAMCRAVAALPVAPDHALIDGNLIPQELTCGAEAIVKGDARSASIAAASIVAKVTRDRIMVELAQHYPDYGWERNAAYPTKAHLQALRDFGVTPHHRRSFRPVYNMLCRENSVSD